MNILEIYEGSDGEKTKRLYQELEQAGPIGLIAINLFRASKASARAKVYRGGNFKGRYRDQAYQKKQWSIDNLCSILSEHAAAFEICWGWKEDLAATYHVWVLYVDLPNGQVSFHTKERCRGPDYPGVWDRAFQSASRIVSFVDKIHRSYYAAITSEIPQDVFAYAIADLPGYTVFNIADEDPDRGDAG